MSCPKQIPKSTKEKSTREWAKSLMNRVKALPNSTNPNEAISTIMSELSEKKDDLTRIGMNVDQMMNQLQSQMNNN
jgi:hypothetical protein